MSTGMQDMSTLPAHAQSVVDRLATSPEHGALMVAAWRLGNELDASFDGALGRPHWQISRDYDRAQQALTSYEQAR
jgi:hypothetical protein